jgi:hypothetical protein
MMNARKFRTKPTKRRKTRKRGQITETQGESPSHQPEHHDFRSPNVLQEGRVPDFRMAE